jgi:hypothetical protein
MGVYGGSRQQAGRGSASGRCRAPQLPGALLVACLGGGAIRSGSRGPLSGGPLWFLLLNRSDYWDENIMTHEFAHTVMLLGFSSCQLALVNRLHATARASGAYDNGIYMLADANEVRRAQQRAGV